jgi:prepilin-type N-terminal cleavage/methylation domain-containing protein
LELELSRRDGFTLVECLVAIVLFAVIILAIAPLFWTGVRADAAGLDYSTVARLSRDKLEHLMNEPITAAELLVPAGQTTASFGNDLPARVDPVTGAPSTNASYPLYPYTRTWTVELFHINADNSMTAVVSGAPYQVKRVTVSVASARTGLPGLRRVAVTALLNNPDPEANRL